MHGGLPPSGGSDGPDLSEVFVAIRRHIWLVLVIAMASVGVTGWYVYSQPAEYRATAVARLSDSRKRLAGDFGEPSIGMAGLGSSMDPILSQIQVIQSRALAEQVVVEEPLGLQLIAPALTEDHVREVIVAPDAPADTLFLTFGDSVINVSRGTTTRTARYGTPISGAGFSFTVISRPPDVSQATVTFASRDRAVSTLLGRLRARPRKGTDVIDVEYVAADKRTARRSVNAVLRVFQRHSATTAKQASSRRREFAAEQLAQTDSLLMGAQLQLSDFRSTRQISSSSQRMMEGQSSVAQLDIRLGELTADRQALMALLESARREDPPLSEKLRSLVSTGALSGNQIVSSLFVQLAALETQRDSMTAGPHALSATNPDVAKLTLLIRQAQRNVLEAAGGYVSTLDVRVAALRDLRERNARALQGMPAVESEETRLLQRVETMRRLSDQLRQELQNARVTEAVEEGSVELLDPARSGERISNRASLKLTMGALLGVIAGIAFAVLLERLDGSIRSRDQIERSLGVPALAIVPRIDVPAGLSLARVANVLNPSTWSAGNGAKGKGNRKSKQSSARQMVLATNVSETGAEAYRGLRTSLLFSQTSGGLKSVLVTSPSPGDGKTTTAANLAVAFAHQGVKVLIVDADMRRPRLHEVFESRKEPGLSHLLLGFATADQAICETTTSGLSIIPAGRHPPNPSELLGSNQMQKIVRELEQRFDVVIFDTPPLLAATDAAVLSPTCDGAVVVVRAGKTPLNAAHVALSQLRSVNARVLGVVLNDPDAAVASYDAAYYYYYYPYYAPGRG
jgi:succinoglycan biosynthesis transport protein ExoP